MVTVGDITRTRLSEVKIVFIVGANAGVIPKVNSRRQIISDAEREKFATAGIELAPGDVENDYLEQFYLYLSLTKAADRLYISYTENESPSYIISRLCGIFEKLIIRKNSYGENCALCDSAAKEKLSDLINAKRNGLKADEDELWALIRYYMENDESVLDKIHEAFVYSNVTDRLDKEVVDTIRDRLLVVSASQLEKYAECAYSYYLQYILELRERDVKTVNSLDFGTLIHNALRNIYVALAEKQEDHLKDFVWGDAGSIKYDDISGFTSSFTKLVYMAVDRAYMEMYSGFKPEDKFEFMKENIVRVATKAIGKLFVNHDGNGFVPTYFELPYNRRLTLENDKHDVVTVTGRVDRVDINEAENDTGIFRVIDYKTGGDAFDISEVYEGRQLQLIMYLSAVCERLAEKNKDKCPKPEGAYYYKVADAWVTGEAQGSADKKKAKEYELDGISALSGEYEEKFETVLEFVDKKVKNFTACILDGDIKKLPYEAQGNGKQCEYCNYKANCRFDTVSGGNETKRKKYSKTGKDTRAAILDEMSAEIDAENKIEDGKKVSGNAGESDMNKNATESSGKEEA
jgi:ATP-dependent helicase/nuclease subunit B